MRIGPFGRERSTIRHKTQGLRSTCAPSTIDALGYDASKLYAEARANKGISTNRLIGIIRSIGGRRVKRVDRLKPGKHTIVMRREHGQQHTYLVDGKTNTVHNSQFPFPLPWLGKFVLRRDERKGRTTYMYQVPEPKKRGAPIPSTRRRRFLGFLK